MILDDRPYGEVLVSVDSLIKLKNKLDSRLRLTLQLYGKDCPAYRAYDDALRIITDLIMSIPERRIS